MSSSNPQQTLFRHFAAVADALAHEHRLALLELLAQRERSVEALSELLAIPLATVSQHLQRLKRAGLVVDRRAGRQRFYRLTSAKILPIVRALEELAEVSMAEVERLVHEQLKSQDPEPPLEARELLALQAQGGTVILDVRPYEEYEVAHLPGSLNLPLAEILRKLPTLPKDELIVVYCRGPYCLMALTAVKLLRRRGYRVRRLTDGVPEWRRLGLPVEGLAVPDT